MGKKHLPQYLVFMTPKNTKHQHNPTRLKLSYRILKWIAVWRQRDERGASWSGIPIGAIQQIIAYMAFVDILTDWTMPTIVGMLVAFSIMQRVVNYFIGKYDQSHGTWKLEEEFKIKEINPYLRTEVVERLERMEKIINNNAKLTRNRR